MPRASRSATTPRGLLLTHPQRGGGWSAGPPTPRPKLPAPTSSGATGFTQDSGQDVASGVGHRLALSGHLGGGGRSVSSSGCVGAWHMTAGVTGNGAGAARGVLRHCGQPSNRASHPPDDFIARFSQQEDLEMVLSKPWPAAAPFSLHWHRWIQLFMASTGAFRFWVLIGMKGIPAHAQSFDTAQTILGSSSAQVEIANPGTLEDPDNERELFVAA